MSENQLQPREALNKAYLKVKPDGERIGEFKANLVGLIDLINETKSEEFHKNLVIEFLKKTYYGDRYFINTKENSDLVIHNQKGVESKVGVIFETKKPTKTNNAEMPKVDNLNAKAFQPLVLYFLRERVTYKNLDIRYLVVTNVYEWFINEKEALIEKLSSLKKLNNDFKVVYGIKTGNNERFVKQNPDSDGIWKKCVSSADNIKKYIISWKGDFLNVSKDLAGLGNVNYEQPKILIQYIRKLSMKTRLVCALDVNGEYYPLNNYSFVVSEKSHSLKLLLAILNSNLINWYFSNSFIDYNIKPKYIEQIPLSKALTSEKIERIVDEILTAKKCDSNADTSELEKECDALVYQLYGLTEEEIKIVEEER